MSVSNALRSQCSELLEQMDDEGKDMMEAVMVACSTCPVVQEAFLGPDLAQAILGLALLALKGPPIPNRVSSYFLQPSLS